MERLRELRKDKGLTTTELGNIIGCSNPTITNYERGYRKPDPETLIKLAEFFGVSVDYLLGLEDRTESASVAPTGEKLTDEERELLALFRELSPYLKTSTLQMVRSWAGKPGAISVPKKA